MPTAKPTVGDLINSVVSQWTYQFPDQDRLATAQDLIQMMQTMTMVVKGFIEAGFK